MTLGASTKKMSEIKSSKYVFFLEIFHISQELKIIYIKQLVHVELTGKVKHYNC